MSEPKVNMIESIDVPPQIEAQNEIQEEDSKLTEIVGLTPRLQSVEHSTSMVVMKKIASTALYVATSRLGRKVILSGALYIAGGAIVSAVGGAPVAVVTALIWFW